MRNVCIHIERRPNYFDKITVRVHRLHRQFKLSATAKQNDGKINFKYLLKWSIKPCTVHSVQLHTLEVEPASKKKKNRIPITQTKSRYPFQSDFYCLISGIVHIPSSKALVPLISHSANGHDRCFNCLCIIKYRFFLRAFACSLVHPLHLLTTKLSRILANKMQSFNRIATFEKLNPVQVQIQHFYRYLLDWLLTF